ncbi:hypothetical protein SDC9_203148 [bioreactor metagenome]|uniref:Uncharacterized protein n=1 Tax=bioreactor metagenome TaxID=1076179 RepID=A0A645IWA2_9ZZZZ
MNVAVNHYGILLTACLDTDVLCRKVLNGRQVLQGSEIGQQLGLKGIPAVFRIIHLADKVLLEGQPGCIADIIQHANRSIVAKGLGLIRSDGNKRI